MKVSKDKRIAVLLGGLSKEREISFRSGRAMAQALRILGYSHVTEIDAGHDIAEQLRKERIEVALIALHGRYGEDGTIQGLLEFLKIPYTGSGVLGSAVAMDKVMTKRLFEEAGVRTPPWVAAGKEWKPADLRDAIVKKVGLPAVAKPANEGSTLGLTVVRKESEIEKAHRTALGFDETVLWEKFIGGTELTVSFVGNKPLPPIEIVPKKGLYDYESKYTKGMTEYFCPARVTDDVVRIAQTEAKKAFAAVQCESWGRVDLLYEEGIPWVLEVNTVPGMTETSLVPKAWRAEGGTFESLVETILQDARLKIDMGEAKG
ncbi:MAG: D-alanine--D-alanine ligase [Pseudomonadota bacterium]